MSSIADVREVEFQIVTEDFEEDEEAVIVYNKDMPLPFVFNFINLSNFAFTVANEHNLKELAPTIDKEVKAYGRVIGAISSITGYPICVPPPELDQPLVIEYGERLYRLYSQVVPETGEAVPCYVPYSIEMQMMDEWVSRQENWPLRIINDGRALPVSSYNNKTVH